MSQTPEEIYLHKDEKYSTIDFHIGYDEYSEEVESKGIENYVKYIPENRKEEAVQQIIDKACEWWKDEFTYPTMTETEIDWCKEMIERFRKAMEAEK